VVQIDPTAFKQWYSKKYNVDLGQRKAKKVILFIILYPGRRKISCG
jgi:hypothetical protein